MGNVIGFRPYDDEGGWYEGRVRRSARTGRFVRSEMDGDPYEARERRYNGERNATYGETYGGMYGRSEREYGPRAYYDGDDREYRGGNGFDGRIHEAPRRREYGREMNDGRRGYGDDRDGYD